MMQQQIKPEEDQSNMMLFQKQMAAGNPMQQQKPADGNFPQSNDQMN